MLLVKKQNVSLKNGYDQQTKLTNKEENSKSF